ISQKNNSRNGSYRPQSQTPAGRGGVRCRLGTARRCGRCLTPLSGSQTPTRAPAPAAVPSAMTDVGRWGWGTLSVGSSAEMRKVSDTPVGESDTDLAGSSTCPGTDHSARSEEHTSELQSRENLVCRLLLE